MRSPAARPGGSRCRQWIAALTANMAAVCGGTAVSWSSPTLPVLMGEVEDIGQWAGAWSAAELLPARNLTDIEGSMVASLVPLGALVGAIPTGALVHVVGVRRPLLALAVLFAIGWGLIMLAGVGGVWCMLVGRALHGMLTGASTVLVPRYCDEMAEVAVRGTLGSLLDLSMCNGVLVVYIMAAYLPYGLLTIVSSIFPVIFALTFYFMPESPVFLARKGRREKALESLAWFRPGWGSEALAAELKILTAEEPQETDTAATAQMPLHPRGTPPPVEEASSSPPVAGGSHGDTPRSPTHSAARRTEDDPEEAPEQVPEQVIEQSPEAELVTPSGCLGNSSCSAIEAKGCFIVFTLMFSQQIAAISAVIAYSTQIFADAGGSLSPRYAVMVLGALQSFAGIFAVITVERVGRRPLLLGSSFVVCLSLASLVVISPVEVPWIPPVALGVYIFAFELGLGPLPWFIAAELVGPTANGVAVAINWMTAAAVTMAYPSLAQLFGAHKVFGAFAGASALVTFFTLFLVPETRGKTHVQLREVLRRWPRRVLTCRRAAGASAV